MARNSGGAVQGALPSDLLDVALPGWDPVPDAHRVLRQGERDDRGVGMG